MNNEKMAISRKQIASEVPMVANEITDDCIYTGLFGSLDSDRMNVIANKITKICEEKQISVVIIDLGNVDAIDTAVSGHLSNLVNILRLVGSEPIICGITSALANTMVKAGVSLDRINIKRNLKDALQESLKLTGYKLAKITQD